MVEQSFELSKKFEPSHVMKKRFENLSSFSVPKRSKETWDFGKSIARSAMLNRMQDNQSTVSVGSVKGSNKKSEMSGYVVEDIEESVGN